VSKKQNRNHSTTIPGVSSITYSGYLYKRSNYPHRNPGEILQQQQQLNDVNNPYSAADGTTVANMYSDDNNPELPIMSMPGMFSSYSTATTTASSNNNDNNYVDVKQPSSLASSSSAEIVSPHNLYDDDTTTIKVAATPSPASASNTNNNNEGTEESQQQQINQYEQQQKKNNNNEQSQKNNNPIQQGLKAAASFFGIELKDDNKYDDCNNLDTDHNRKSITPDDNYNHYNQNNEKDDEKTTQTTALLSTTINPKIKKSTTSSSPIKVGSSSSSSNNNNSGFTYTNMNSNSNSSPSRQDRNQSSFHDAMHRRHTAPSMLSESPSSQSELFDGSSNSFGSKHTTGSSSSNNNNCTNIPQDFYDPEDGHLWRAKYCVLEDGILYFYRNANDGDSVEAAAERKQNTCSLMVDAYDNNNNDYYKNIDIYNDNNNNSSNNSTSIGGNIINNNNSNNRSSITGNNKEGQMANTLSALTSSTATASSAAAATKSRRISSAQDLSKSPMIRPGMLHHTLDSSGVSSADLDTPCIWEKRVFMDCVGGVRTAEQQFGKNSFELQAMDDDDYDQNLIDTLVLKAQNSIEMKEWIFQFHRSLASFMRNIIDVVGSTSTSGVFLDIHHPRTMLSSSHSSRHLSSSSLIARGERGSIPQSSSEKHLHRLISTSPSLQRNLSHGHGRTTLKRRMDIKRTPSDCGASLSSTPDRSDTTDYYSNHPFGFWEPSPNNMIRLSPESVSPPSRFLIPPPVNSITPGINKNNKSAIEWPISQLSQAELSELSGILPRLDTGTVDRPKPITGKYIPPHLRGNNDIAASKSKYIPPHLRQNHQFTPITPPTDTVQLDQLDIIDESATGFIRGGCADPQLIHGSILDQEYIPKRASRLEKTHAEAHGSYGGSFPSDLSDTKKKSSKLRWEVGAISECGIRESQEDSYVLNNDLLKTFESGPFGSLPQTYWNQEETDHSLGLFAIFDGHCGNQGARFAVERLGRFIHDELLLVESNDSHHQNQSDASSLHPSNIESILSEAMVKMDNEFCNLCQLDGREWESGACAAVAIVANENLVVASLGDCRGILCRFVDDATSYESDDLWCQLDTELDDVGQFSSESNKSEGLHRCFWKEVTTVHSPSAEKESERIKKANGWITTETEIPIGQLRRMDFQDEDVIDILKRCLHYPSGNGGTKSFTDSERSVKECKAAPQRIIHISRVCGELAVSRAIGDRDFKASFNAMSSPEESGDHDEITTKNNDSCWWESPLFLPYPDNHNHRFKGDLVTNTPDFHRVQLGTDGVLNEFLLLACDGLWDVMDADDAVRIVRDLLFHKKFTAKKAAARLAELAIHLGSSDNITVIVVRLFSENSE
ncbi:MAG: serine/threonine protein phosphatase PrpC, partial [Bacillariaceae sp.]|jgi:serine/threonine protein phosphatase PrpC